MPTFDFWLILGIWLMPPIVAFFYSLYAASKGTDKFDSLTGIWNHEPDVKKPFYQLGGFKLYVVGWLIVWGVIFLVIANDFWDVWFG